MTTRAKKIAAKTSLKTASKKNVEGVKKHDCFEFSFEARSKPITQNILNLEEKRQKKFLANKTKFPISHIVALLERKTPQKGLINPLGQCIFFYKKNETEGAQFLEVLARLILESASNEKQDFAYQTFLLYQAIDTFSMAIQHSEKRINATCQAIMVSIFKILSPINSTGYSIEKEIQKYVNKMLKNSDLSDLEVRDKIIKLCMKGQRYYEAMYHLIEYEKLMKIKSRTMYVIKAGEIQFRKATIFQHMIDFYEGVASSGSEKRQIIDMGKLRSFIFRFNMDSTRFKLVQLAGIGPLAINKTVSSLIQVGNIFYSEAADNNRFSYSHKAYYSMAHNNLTTDKIKSATKNLTLGMEALAKSNLKALEKANEKIKFLEQLVKIYKDHGAPRKYEGYSGQLKMLRNNVRELETKKRDEDAKHKSAN